MNQICTSNRFQLPSTTSCGTSCGCVSNPEQKSKNEDQEQIPIQKFLQFLHLFEIQVFSSRLISVALSLVLGPSRCSEQRSQRSPCQLWQIEKTTIDHCLCTMYILFHLLPEVSIAD
jgi:hypothetical protein